MERELDENGFREIVGRLRQSLGGLSIEYAGDISDLGNEIGIKVGTAIEGMTEEEISDFISGFRHGVSLTNGTH